MDLLSSIHSNIVFSLEIIKWKNYPEWSLFNLCSPKKKKKNCIHVEMFELIEEKTNTKK